MRLTSFSDFGLRALMRMAGEPDRQFSTAELADEFRISRNHLTKAISALSAAGYLRTRRGGGGGAVLARSPHDMRIGNIVAVLEQRSPIVECFQEGGGACIVTPVCRLKSILASGRDSFIEELNRHTLADCALPAKGVAGDDDHG